LRNLAPFAIGKVVNKLNRIRVSVRDKYNRPFPKPELFWLSKYNYQPRHIKIHPDGRIAGGLSRFVSSLIDFSFVRAIVAHKYCLTGCAYDPVSIFLLELFRYLEKFPSMKDFVKTVRDKEKGKHYRPYAGIDNVNLPCEATFTNFKDRLGEKLYNEIFHVLVGIVELLGLISYKILTTDGTLFHTNARYRGCTYFCEDCNFIEFEGVIENVRQRILNLLRNPEKIVPGKEIRIKLPCPSLNFPEDIKRPRVEALSLFLKEMHPERPSIFNGIFELEKQLNEARLDPMVKRGVITRIVMGDSISSDAFFFKCPKLPADKEARIGVRRNPQNPNRKQKIFGFNAVIDTSVEMDLGLELPVACSTLAGNAHEGKHYIINRDQILEHHGKTSKIDLADAKYDEHDNFTFSRSRGAIPIIDYNRRSENVTAAALKERGYDRNGWPYAPCGGLTRPNGFDFNCHRASFSCRRQCVDSKVPKIAEYAESCPHWINSHGYTKHMSIHEFPRLITEVIRGTDRHQKLKNLRTASERTNATAKEDFTILSKPKIRGLEHAGILSQVAVIVVLLKRVACFIVKVTLALRKNLQGDKSPPKFFVPGPSVPKFILNLVMRE
jgi:hypothetical protein